jgi:aryl-alcohol dehydrogenase-like predicted oxidoreductase
MKHLRPRACLSRATWVILEPTRLEHLEEALKGLDLRLDSSTTKVLDAVTPD